MALTVFNTGDVPSATQVNNLFVNTLFVRKGSDESVTSNTTLQDDDVLQLTLEANTSFEVRLFIRYTASLAGDLKFAFAGPAGSSFDYYSLGMETAAGGVTGLQGVTITMPTAVGHGGLAGTTVGVVIEGLAITAGTAGVLKLQWAQNTSDGTATVVKAGSFMVARRVA